MVCRVTSSFVGENTRVGGIEKVNAATSVFPSRINKQELFVILHTRSGERERQPRPLTAYGIISVLNLPWALDASL